MSERDVFVDVIQPGIVEVREPPPMRRPADAGMAVVGLEVGINVIERLERIEEMLARIEGGILGLFRMASAAAAPPSPGAGDAGTDQESESGTPAPPPTEHSTPGGPVRRRRRE